MPIAINQKSVDKGNESIHRIVDEEIEFYPYKAKTKPTIDNPQCFETAKLRGPCKGHYNRWSYVPKSGKCKQFVYGGCHGSSNNFQTEESCNEKCPHLKSKLAVLPVGKNHPFYDYQ